MNITHLAQQAKQTSYLLTRLQTKEKNEILHRIHDELQRNEALILEQNRLDLEDSMIAPTLRKRLGLQGKFSDLLQGVKQVIALPDPNNRVLLSRQLAQGLELFRVSCPIGLLLIIFEARPEVVVQIICLALKSGNACILKGGKEAFYSNQILFDCIQKSLPTELQPAYQLVHSRQDISELLRLDCIDLVIPRGSNQLVQYCKDNTRIPVLGHADGICSTFVDEFADVTKAIQVVVDGKTNYPAACNATETVLVHSKFGALQPLVNALLEANVKIHACSRSYEQLSPHEHLLLAKEEDYKTEFLDFELALKIVDSLDQAIDHINSHGSHHTDTIVTEHESHANQFMTRVDSAGTFWNASTRFADGFRYGFGAEIGVSTNKTHARGPVGLEGLMIYKYRIYGNGHCVGEFSNGTRTYDHKDHTIEYGESKLVFE
jgi:glutamate-5-semialdehyde dehydrogenase